MYEKYHTDALVLSIRDRGEADRVIALYTKDFGLTYARASSVRRERSRMRYALQSYARAHVSLIRGKRGWRVGGAIAQSQCTRGAKGMAVLARVTELVIRLVRGEEKNEYLFAALAEAHSALQKAREDAVPTIEIVCVARVLYALGYLSAEAQAATIFAHTAYSLENLEEAETMRDRLLSSINKAISETQL